LRVEFEPGERAQVDSGSFGLMRTGHQRLSRALFDRERLRVERGAGAEEGHSLDRGVAPSRAPRSDRWSLDHSLLGGRPLRCSLFAIIARARLLTTSDT
jgi:hypothetical protein